MSTMEGYEKVMDGPFAPVYPHFAKLMVQRSGISTGTLIDIGSHKGNLGFAVLGEGNFDHAIFLDLRESALDMARRSAEEHGIGDICEFLNCDVTDIDLPDESVDLAVSRGSLPFWKNQRGAIREIYRILKPEGCAYVGCGLGPRPLKEHVQRNLRILRGEDPDGPSEKTKNEEPKTGELAKDKSERLPDAEYANLFQEMGCSYAIINSVDEGKWLIFAKK